MATSAAQGGKRTVLVDPFDRVGVPGGASPHEGYWLPWGHRDGYGMRQSSFTTYRWNFDAAARLGIELPLVGPHNPTMLCHLAPQGDVLSFSLDPSAFDLMAREVLRVADPYIPEFRTPRQLAVLGATWLSVKVRSPNRQVFLDNVERFGKEVINA